MEKNLAFECAGNARALFNGMQPNGNINPVKLPQALQMLATAVQELTARKAS